MKNDHEPKRDPRLQKTSTKFVGGSGHYPKRGPKSSKEKK